MRTMVVWLGLLLFIAGCSNQQPPSSADQPSPLPPMTPEPVYNFTLKTLAGETVSLDEFQGEWVLINFWATWCHPCVEEMPYLQQIADEGDMVVLGVNFNESPEVVTQFVDEHHISFPILMDPSEVILTMYQARSLPRTFVVDPDGMVVQRIVGPVIPEQFDPWREQNVTQLAQN
ncbi:MAG TPA: redoxin domain-containing protein [Anaerolineae bacterium]|nr:redoxin domain-containing protein [Anaerolineae bacterium]HMR63844.1 redoxin domain-containing protein [Anaerolineae bacterium]